MNISAKKVLMQVIVLELLVFHLYGQDVKPLILHDIENRYTISQ